MKASAPAYHFRRNLISNSSRSLDEAFSKVISDLASAAGDVFEAHLQILDDPLLRETIDNAVSEGSPADEAIQSASVELCSMFASIDDEYLRARVDDVRDVCRRLFRAVRGEDSEIVRFPYECILVAEELFPSDLANADLSCVRGIICAKGSTTSHVCIIAHSKGIPVQMGKDISLIYDGQMVEVDDPFICTGLRRKILDAGLKVFANAGNIDQIRTAIAAGADGIGMFRTEFAFLGTSMMPSFEEQKALYREAIEACCGKPIIFRTLDVGGDKDIPWMKLPQEANPFLGLRGIRLTLKHPQVLETQISAIEEAASEVPGSTVKIIFPMINDAAELRSAKSFMKSSLECGIMIETPASILNLDELARECSFASIGTNDLTQYILAADRCSADVSYIYDPFCPAMRKTISYAVAQAHSFGLEVGICGELASSPKACDFLIEAGIDSFSLNMVS